MKKKEAIRRAVVSMYEAREAWEVARANASGNPIMPMGYQNPIVQYLPGKGWMINGVEWPYTTEYVLNHFNQQAADYRAQAQIFIEMNAIADEAQPDDGIPF